MRRLWPMVRKEFIQMRRDRVTFAMMVGIPLLQLTLFGYAINSDPKHLPTAIRAAVPQQGRLLTFRRAVQVDTDLRVELKATVARAASTGVTLLMMIGIFVVLAVLAAAGRRLTGSKAE